MKLVVQVHSNFEVAAIQHVRKYRQPIPPNLGDYPLYIYLIPTDWAWSSKRSDDTYTLVPLQAILQPQDYPEYYL